MPRSLVVRGVADTNQDACRADRQTKAGYSGVPAAQWRGLQGGHTLNILRGNWSGVVGIADFDRNGIPTVAKSLYPAGDGRCRRSGGATYQGWAYLNAAGVPGWTVAGAMALHTDGQPDLIWQNETTQQVTVNYYGGTGGTVYQGWAWMNSLGFAGWQALAVN